MPIIKEGDKIVHIHAKCDAFEFHEHVSEKHACKRLRNILKNFQWYQRKYGKTKSGKLKVNTVVVNQQLFYQ